MTLIIHMGCERGTSIAEITFELKGELQQKLVDLKVSSRNG